MLGSEALDALFRKARTYNAFHDRAVSDAQLQQIHELMKWGPTSANCQPARLVFLRTPEAKERLRPALSPGNLAKTMKAPVTVIIAYDTQFFDHLPRMFPHDASARSWFAGEAKKAAAEATAFRNGTLQGAYFIVAARAVGLDCGPMSGFDAAKVDAEFFPDRRLRANFLVNLGYGDAANLFARSPRFTFEEQCTLL